MLSYLQAVALANAHGITAEQYLAYAKENILSLPNFIEFYTPRLNAGEHPGDVDRLAMGTASVEHVVHTFEDAGLDPSFSGGRTGPLPSRHGKRACFRQLHKFDRSHETAECITFGEAPDLGSGASFVLKDVPLFLHIVLQLSVLFLQLHLQETVYHESIVGSGLTHGQMNEDKQLRHHPYRLLNLIPQSLQLQCVYMVHHFYYTAQRMMLKLSLLAQSLYSSLFLDRQQL